MATLASLKAQGLALIEQQKNLIENDPRPWSQKQPESAKLQNDIDAVLAQAKGLQGPDLSFLADGSAPSPFGPRLKGMAAGIAAKGFRPINSPTLDFTNDQLQDFHDAALSQKSYAITSKAADDSTAVTPAGITDYRLPPVTARREPTRVLDLLPTFATNAASVTWYSTTGTTAAAAVAEGGAKPLSHIAYTAQQTAMTKLAHYVEVTDETIMDFAGFLSVLEQDMFAGLVKAENNELLNATVAGADKFAGLLNVSGILTRARTTETNLDAISEAFDDLRVGAAFAEPDGIVMHPSTWGSTRRLKDGNSRYYLQPDPTADTNLSLWGVPVVLTTQIAAGTALIGAFAESVAVYIREGIRLDMANQGTTQFTTNTHLVRAEERLALTVPRPTGLLKLTNLS